MAQRAQRCDYRAVNPDFYPVIPAFAGRFTLAPVKTFPDERPDAAKRCGSQMLTQRGTSDKTAIDLYKDKITVVRYRRSDCGSAISQRP